MRLMPAALPVELRQRIVQAHAHREMTAFEIAAVFQVGLTSVKRFVAKAARGISLQPRSPPGAKPKLSDEELAWLNRQVDTNPYLTSYELCGLYNRAHPRNRVHRSTILRAMHKLGLTHKKRRYWLHNVFAQTSSRHEANSWSGKNRCP